MEHQGEEQADLEDAEHDVAVHGVDVVVSRRPADQGDVDDVQQEEEEHQEAGDPVAHERPLPALALVRPGDLGGIGGRHRRRFLRSYQRPAHMVELAT